MGFNTDKWTFAVIVDDQGIGLIPLSMYNCKYTRLLICKLLCSC